MSFICSISKNIIKKNELAQVIFLKKKDSSYSINDSASGHFQPLGIFFKAKVIDSKKNILDFHLDKKENILKNRFLEFIQNDTLNKIQLIENGKPEDLLNKNFIENPDTIQDVFNNAMNNLLISDDNDSIFAMVIHNNVYTEILNYGEINKYIQFFKNRCEEKNFSALDKKYLEMADRIKNKLIASIGQEEKRIFPEKVIITEEIINIQFQDVIESSEMQDVYESLLLEAKSNLGKTKKVYLERFRLIDEDYIKLSDLDLKRDVLGREQDDTMKQLFAYDLNNSFNRKLNAESVIYGFKSSDWEAILTSYLFENVMNQIGEQFLPSRIHNDYLAFHKNEIQKRIVDIF